MLKYALLASGSKGNCCLIRDENTNIIIDCGSTKKYLTSCFERLQYDHLKSDALFITHTHSDHIAQTKMFKSIPTYCKTDIGVDLMNIISDYECIEVNSLKVQEIPLSHDSGSCSGYVITSNEQKLVYITDTGYIKEEVYEYLKNADYYIFESNHDVEMLMATNRPMFTKQRIISDMGHLCNEDCANILAKLIGENTKEIVLAHLSEQGNTLQKAKEVLLEVLHYHQIDTKNIRIVSAPQFEIVKGGENL